MKMLLTGLLAISALTFGCAEVPVEDEEEMGESASEVVSEDVFARASTVVNGINYLAFGYKLDGCYARALYMSAELAAKGIESNAIYAVARPDFPLEIPGTDDTWGYHVAPMLNVKTGNRIVPRVLDRAMASTPLTATAWVSKMGFAVNDANAPQLTSIAGSDYVADDANEFNRKLQGAWGDVPSFQAMPKFKAADFSHACAVMHAYLQHDSSQPQVVNAKRQRLIVRTEALLQALRSRSKLEGSPSSFSAASCGSCRNIGTVQNPVVNCSRQ